MAEHPHAGPWAATVLRIIDADTYEVRVRLPMHTERRERVRLRNVSAPEKRTPEGQAAIDFLVSVMPVSDQIEITTYLMPSTGDEEQTLARYLADVRLWDGSDLGELLIAQGHARPGAFEG